MNLWLMTIGQQLTYIYDKKVKEQQFQEHIYDRIYSQINKPQDKNNSQEIKEWDES
jgi:hypothetical protein